MDQKRTKSSEDEEAVISVTDKQVKLKVRDGWVTYARDGMSFVKLWVHYPNLPDKIPAVLAGIDEETGAISVRLVINGLCIDRAVTPNMITDARHDLEWSTWTRISEVPSNV